MQEINLMDAFASYHVKLAQRGRSAMSPDGDLVISCWYVGFKRANAEILRYEEDLTGQTSGVASALRTHLAEALTSERDVRAIVAVAGAGAKPAPTPAPPSRTTYYARKDLVGRVFSFDGQRFVVEFRRTPPPVEEIVSKGALKRRTA